MKNVVLLVLLVVLPSVLNAQTRWFASDSLGSWSADATAALAPGKGWWIGISSEVEMQKQVLFRDGAEVQQRWVEFDSARREVLRRTFVGGVITSEVSLQPGTTLVLSETVFRQGEPTTVIRFSWASTGLLSRHVENSQGQWLWDDRVFRYPNGRLRRLERTGPSGPLAQISWSNSDSGSPEVWIADEDLLAAGRHKVLSTDAEGLREDLWQQAELLSTKLTTELPDGRSQRRETLPSTGQVTSRLSDARGRLIEETVTLKDQTTQMTRWTWDENDRVVHEESAIRGGWETADYLYPDVGAMVIEKRRLGVLSSRETRQDGEKVLVELYDQGQKFLEEVWAEGRKVLERYFQDGQLVRERQR